MDGDTRLRRQQLNDDRRRQFGETGRSLAFSGAEYDAARPGPGPIVHPTHRDDYWYLATPNPSNSGTLTANETSDSVISTNTPPLT